MSVDIVDALLRARRTGAAVANDDVAPSTNLMTAYDQQAAHVRALLAEEPSQRVIGYKVGATSLAAQRHLGLGGPFFAPLLSSQASASPTRLKAGDFFHRIVEVEIAFRLGADLRPKPGATSIARRTLLDAVAAVMPAIEIADSRLASWRTASGLAAVADLGFSGHWIHGAERADIAQMDPRAAAATLFVDGIAVGAGQGADVLGDPLRALELLSLHLRAHGQMLRAGDIVTSGSMTGAFEASSPARILARIEGFSDVEVEFE